MKRTAYNVLTLTLAPLNTGQSISLLRGSCLITVLKILTSVAGQLCSFLIVMEHFLLAMCKPSNYFLQGFISRQNDILLSSNFPLYVYNTSKVLYSSQFFTFHDFYFHLLVMLHRIYRNVYRINFSIQPHSNNKNLGDHVMLQD